MLVTTREQQRTQCSLLVQQALGTLPRRPASSMLTPDPVPPELEPDTVADTVHKAFSRAPTEVATAILNTLGDLDRVHLLLALQATTNRDALARRDSEYVDDLLKTGRSSPTHAGLTRGQIANAVAYQRMLQRYSSYSHNPPSTRQLAAVALASGLPFVGFGFCDNLVMILAGDTIDALFGARLGITTLAAAGLGNIVADVVGVGATQQIKEQSRKVRWAAPPRLSTLQQAMKRTRFIKVFGACAGVSVGCVLGMVPLAWLPPGFFESQGLDKHAASPSAAAVTPAAALAGGREEAME